MVNGGRKSDSLIVPGKPLNKALGQAAERVEGRRLAKGNLLERDTLRTQGRVDVPHALERVRQAAQRDRKLQFTAILHHVYAIEQLRGGLFCIESRGGPLCRWRDMAGVWEGSGGESSGTFSEAYIFPLDRCLLNW